MAVMVGSEGECARARREYLMAEAEPKCRDAFKGLAWHLGQVGGWCMRGATRALLAKRRGGRWSAGGARRAAGVCVNALVGMRKGRAALPGRPTGHGQDRTAPQHGGVRVHERVWLPVPGWVNLKSEAAGGRGHEARPLPARAVPVCLGHHG